MRSARVLPVVLAFVVLALVGCKPPEPSRPEAAAPKKPVATYLRFRYMGEATAGGHGPTLTTRGEGWTDLKRNAIAVSELYGLTGEGRRKVVFIDGIVKEQLTAADGQTTYDERESQLPPEPLGLLRSYEQEVSEGVLTDGKTRTIDGTETVRLKLTESNAFPGVVGRRGAIVLDVRTSDYMPVRIDIRPGRIGTRVPRSTYRVFDVARVPATAAPDDVFTLEPPD